MVHNFNPAHWATFDYSPGIDWGSMGAYSHNYGNGLVTMWAPFSNVEYLKFAHEQMHKENRVVYANMGPCFEHAMAAPFVDAWGVEATIANSTDSMHSMMRMMAGTKPLSHLYPDDGKNVATEDQIKQAPPVLHLSRRRLPG